MNNLWNVYEVIFFIIELVCLELILKESTIFHTVYFRLIYVCVSVYLIGATFKIMHWFGGDEILLISISGIALVYLVRTIYKRTHILLDYIKCAWVMCAALSSLIHLFHWPYGEITGYFTLGLFVLMFILFLLTPENPSKDDYTYEDKPIDQIN